MPGSAAGRGRRAPLGPPASVRRACRRRAPCAGRAQPATRRTARTSRGVALRRAVHAHVRVVRRATGSSRSGLPGTSPAVLDAGMTYEGFEHLDAALAAGRGRHPRAPAPRRLGVGRVLAGEQCSGSRSPSSSSRSSRRSCSSGSPSCARSFGMNVVPLGPDAGHRGRSRRCKANHVRVPAVRPRHRRRRRRGRVLRRAHHAAGRPGHARAAHRRAVLPTAVYFKAPRPPAVRARPPIADRARRAGLRDDVARVTQVAGATSSRRSSAPRPSSGTSCSRTGRATTRLARPAHAGLTVRVSGTVAPCGSGWSAPTA